MVCKSLISLDFLACTVLDLGIIGFGLHRSPRMHAEGLPGHLVCLGSGALIRRIDQMNNDSTVAYRLYAKKTVMSKVKYPDVTVGISKERGEALSIVSRTSKALKRAGVHPSIAKEYREEAMSGDYDHLLQVTMAWVRTT